MAESPTIKVCKECKMTKPLGDFSPMPRGVLGRNPRCKICRNNRLTAMRNAKRKLAPRPPPRPRPFRAVPLHPSDPLDLELNRLFASFLRLIARPGEQGNIGPIAGFTT